MTDTLPKDAMRFTMRDLVDMTFYGGETFVGGGDYDNVLKEIERLGAEVARYENGRQVLTLLINTQRDKIRELEAERDQYKQIAEINANTIKCMQAAVNLHGNRIDEIYGVKP